MKILHLIEYNPAQLDIITIYNIMRKKSSQWKNKTRILFSKNLQYE